MDCSQIIDIATAGWQWEACLHKKINATHYSLEEPIRGLDSRMETGTFHSKPMRLTLTLQLLLEKVVDKLRIVLCREFDLIQLALSLIVHFYRNVKEYTC